MWGILEFTYEGIVCRFLCEGPDRLSCKMDSSNANHFMAYTLFHVLYKGLHIQKLLLAI